MRTLVKRESTRDSLDPLDSTSEQHYYFECTYTYRPVPYVDSTSEQLLSLAMYLCR
jgi:hypothetical protein